MALTVEDGTGLADAESFISVADATSYHANRGNAAWAALASDTVREQALRKATDYMEAAYRMKWAGKRVSVDQALSWPRYDVPMRDAGSYYDSDSVPAAVANACAELALRAASAELAPDVDRLKKRVKVDVIETEYFEGGNPNTQYRAIDLMLEPFFGASGSTIQMVRG